MYDEPVLIAGCSRTGSTGLTVSLNSIPGVCIWNELMVYADWAAPLHPALGRLRHFDTLAEADERGWRHPMDFRNPLLFQMDSPKIADDLEGRFITSAKAQVIRDYLYGLAEKLDGPLRAYGDKGTLEYARHLPQLMEAYPDAKIVYTVRDGRDVACSAAKGRADAAPGCAGTWLQMMDMFESCRDRRPEQFHVVKMEVAKAVPEGMFKDLAEFIGLEYTSAELDGFLKLYKPKHIGRYKEECPDIVARVSNRGFDRMLERWGYL